MILWLLRLAKPLISTIRCVDTRSSSEMTGWMAAQIAADSSASPASPGSKVCEIQCRRERWMARHSSGSLSCRMLFVRNALKRNVLSVHDSHWQTRKLADDQRIRCWTVLVDRGLGWKFCDWLLTDAHAVGRVASSRCGSVDPRGSDLVECARLRDRRAGACLRRRLMGHLWVWGCDGGLVGATGQLTFGSFVRLVLRRTTDAPRSS